MYEDFNSRVIRAKYKYVMWRYEASLIINKKYCGAFFFIHFHNL